jgi:hypothetical protein
MAALNQAETQALRDVIATLDRVLREGFDKDEPLDSPKRKTIVLAKKKVHTVVQMKGYYPS